MKSILHYQEIQGLQALLQDVEIRERNNRIRGNDPEGTNLLADRGLDDVGIGQASGSRNAIRIDLPQARQSFSIFGVFKFPVPWQTRREARFTRTHRVALSSNGKGRSAGATDIS